MFCVRKHEEKRIHAKNPNVSVQIQKQCRKRIYLIMNVGISIEFYFPFLSLIFYKDNKTMSKMLIT